MKLAAVDIGSNAIRLQVTHVTHFEGKTNFKKLEYLRFPLRLGLDVFHSQKISDKNRRKFVKLMKAFKLLIDLYEVDDYMVCATSAMRESVNGREICEEVREDIGMKINIIDGNHEAELINMALGSYIDEKSYLHIDVGGGSTELNIYINQEKIATKSFKIGSVRALDDSIPVSVWKSMNKFITDHVTKQDLITCIGTGGNISKILELSNPRKNVRLIGIDKIMEIQAYLESFSYEDRINKLNLNPDRADVIIPASKIYLAAMSAANSKKMMIPDVGLKDGMMQVLYKKNKNKRP
ncbi:Ppx/GppA phosphatase family protein [Cognataquiflexum rubidum]|uniref:Ppx/GppA phosphatase family protein n=1 Tax=Cognataquiflexum rubidum TaxID=2922273 RepID=UPI001F130FE1|nr:phosphatase [Cognataquiflexum rubidum]MCH6235098.1 phosphatase [Cognataquiflexum rubidum]